MVVTENEIHEVVRVCCASGFNWYFLLCYPGDNPVISA